LQGGAGRSRWGGLPWSVEIERARLAAHASHKGSRDHEGGVDGVAPCARAQGDAFGLNRQTFASRSDLLALVDQVIVELELIRTGRRCDPG
jgi:hypothetical protein